MTPQTQTQLDILKSGITKVVPLVADFLQVHRPLGEYSKTLYDHQAHPVHQERQKNIKVVMQEVLARSFTEEEIARANLNWDDDLVINIIDHQGFLNHPLLISTNLIANKFRIPGTNPNGIVVLTDSGVPLNNFFHKRGLKFANQQLNIFPTRDRHIIAYAAPTYTEFGLMKSAKQFDFSDEELTFLQTIQDELEQSATHPKCTS